MLRYESEKQKKNPALWGMEGRKDYLFEEVLQLWIDNNRIRQKGATVNKYQYMIRRHILPELGGRKLSELTAPLINSFLTRKLLDGRLDKGGGLSPSYVQSLTLIIRSALKFAADEQMCKPLLSPIYKPAAMKKELGILSLEEQRRLERYLAEHPNPTGLAVLLSLHAGLRIGEVCALSWEDLDLTEQVIHVRHTVARVQQAQDAEATSLIIDHPKTRASLRDIPISSFLLPSLREAGPSAKKGYVASGQERFVSPRSLEYRYHCLLQKCGVRRVNYHALRHTFATRCVEAGVDVKSLSEILGHANVSVTLNTYVHSSMAMKRVQMEKLSHVSSLV